MGIQLNSFMRCECGKLHVVSSIWLRTACPNCDRSLWNQLFPRD